MISVLQMEKKSTKYNTTKVKSKNICLDLSLRKVLEERKMKET